ncbi:MgtC/SapB family protein [Stutzerimonas urumqiensis]|uniref:MgtC/SapB family protein n=1 Tax=Stutzerimonas urumqiensis TaxID=638269 RepID=UPI003BAACE8D
MDWWDILTRTLASEFADIPDLEEAFRVAIRLSLATILGGLLGYERESKGKAAGLRTHMLVCLGAALFALAPLQAGVELNDLSRVIQGIVTGIGFLGAGTILKGDTAQDVHGLTTAAGIWLTAAIGVTCGLGHEATAVFTTAMALIVLKVMPILERHAARTHRLARGPDDDRGDDAA